jgi:putative membrane protein
MMRFWNDSWFCGPGALGGGHWGWLFSLGFWLVLVFILLVLFRNFGVGRVKSAELETSALEILKRRYAAGEIEREEFELRKRDLQ